MILISPVFFSRGQWLVLHINHLFCNYKSNQNSPSFFLPILDKAPWLCEDMEAQAPDLFLKNASPGFFGVITASFIHIYQILLTKGYMGKISYLFNHGHSPFIIIKEQESDRRLL